MQTGIIYAYRNKINGKYYVGKTKFPETRKKLHLSGKSKCPKFSSAINKYGKDSFEYFVLVEDIYSNEELNDWERYFIWLYRSNVNGYNLTPGGDGLDSETLKKISNTPEARKARSISAKKQFTDKCFLEKYMKQRREISQNENYKIKQKEIMKKFAMTEIYKSYQKERLSKIIKPVVCIETGLFYESITCAQKTTGAKHVNEVCIGRRKTAGGYHWRFATPEEVERHKSHAGA